MNKNDLSDGNWFFTVERSATHCTGPFDQLLIKDYSVENRGSRMCLTCLSEKLRIILDYQ